MMEMTDILESVAKALEHARDGAFVNPSTGAVVTAREVDAVSDSVDRELEADEYEEACEKALDELLDGCVEVLTDYVPAYRAMEDFIGSFEEGEVSARLRKAVDGRGAFKRFDEAVKDLGLREEWRSFRKGAFLRYAREWCDANGIPYRGKTSG